MFPYPISSFQGIVLLRLLYLNTLLSCCLCNYLWMSCLWFLFDSHFQEKKAKVCISLIFLNRIYLNQKRKKFGYIIFFSFNEFHFFLVGSLRCQNGFHLGAIRCEILQKVTITYSGLELKKYSFITQLALTTAKLSFFRTLGFLLCCEWWFIYQNETPFCCMTAL